MRAVMPLLLAVSVSTAAGQSSPPSTSAIKLLASCQLDVTGDKLPDVAMLIETRRGLELVALVADATGYRQAAVLFRPEYPGELSCRVGRRVRETKAGGGSGQVVATPGGFIELVYPEQSSVAFVWDGQHFIEVWTSD
jgi:hypothetical protein